MSKTKVMYCYDCGRDTEHKLVCKENPVTGFLSIRNLLRTTELEDSVIAADNHYKCTRCGKTETAK